MAKERERTARLRGEEWRWLNTLDIGTLVDVGANTGQFARRFLQQRPGSLVYSFEPLEDCFDELQRQMAGVPGFTAFNVALGDSEGEVDFYRSEFSPSSSLYESEATIQEISGLLDDCGFAFMGMVDQYLRPDDSLPVYGDALFVSRATLERCGNWTAAAVMPRRASSSAGG